MVEQRRLYGTPACVLPAHTWRQTRGVFTRQNRRPTAVWGACRRGASVNQDRPALIGRRGRRLNRCCRIDAAPLLAGSFPHKDKVESRRCLSTFIDGCIPPPLPLWVHLLHRLTGSEAARQPRYRCCIRSISLALADARRHNSSSD